MTNMPAADAAAIFAAVKDAASKTAWAAGVALARSVQITFERKDGSDWHYLLTTPTNGVATPCMVNPAEEDWHCPSKETDDPCRFVAALVICLQKTGGKIAAPKKPALALGYFFSAKDGALYCQRGFFEPAGAPVAPLFAVQGSVKNTASRPAEPVLVSTADIELDPWLCHLEPGAGDSREPIPKTSMAAIFTALAAHKLPCFWQGKAVTVHKAPFPEAIAISDDGDQVLVRLNSGSSGERFTNGAVLLAGKKPELWLPPTSAAAPLPAEARWLAAGRRFKPYELAYLVSEVLPALSERFTCQNTSRRLPVLVKERPRPSFYCEATGDELIVTPGLAYGDPPIAKVEKKALVLTGDECPERDRNGEYAISDKMGRKLAMVPGDTVTFSGSKAQVMADRIAAFASSHRGLLFSRHPATGKWRQDRRDASSAGNGAAGSTGSVPATGLSSFKTHPPLTPHISLGGSDFSLEFKVEGIGEVAPAKVFEAFRAGESNLPLMGGGFSPLPLDWLQRFGPQLAQLWQAKMMAGDKKSKPLPRSLWPAYMDLASELDPSFRPSRELAAFTEALTAPAPAAPLPTGLNAELRPYQRQGYDWLSLRQRHKLGAILADDMGLGKTLQTICALPAHGPSLVVCPTSVLFNWQRELSRFRPGLNTALHHGSGRDLNATLKSAPNNKGLALLTSYGTLRRDADKLAAIDWQMVVLDEAQTIKNPASQVSRAAYKLSANFKLALTGTPIENSLMDLWSQFQFLLPGFLGDYKPFATALGSADQAGHIEVVKEQIAPYILRRTKKQVLTDLPEKIESILYYELSDSERERYDALYAAGQPKVQKLLQAGGKLEILEIILRLRQACCHPELGRPEAEKRPNEESGGVPAGKLRPLLAKLSQLKASGGGKSLIFSQWTGFLTIIERQLAKEGIKTVRLDGQTRDRGSVVESFQDDPSVEVMLISLKAGATGLNLTAAENVFIMDPWWNPAIENQAADRAYRIGQKNTVQIFRIVALSTIEENIVVLKDAKQQLADATLGQGQEEPSKGPNLTDIASLFAPENA